MLAILRRSVSVYLVSICFFAIFASAANAQGSDAASKPPAETSSTTDVKKPGASADVSGLPPGAPETPTGESVPDPTNGANQAPPGPAGGTTAVPPLGDVPTDATPPGFKMLEVPKNSNAPKAPPSSGKPQIGIQMPAYKQLAWFLRINAPAAVQRIKNAEAKMRIRLTQAGMDPNISIDDAMELGKPVINVYLKKSVGDNILAHGFCLQAYLCQYQKLPSGMIKTSRFARIGESPEVYSGADFEDKVVMLVDAYLSARHHQIKEAKAAAAKKKPVAKGKKTK